MVMNRAYSPNCPPLMWYLLPQSPFLKNIKGSRGDYQLRKFFAAAVSRLWHDTVPRTHVRKDTIPNEHRHGGEMNRKQGEWIEKNIPEDGGFENVTKNCRVTLDDIGIARQDSPKFRIEAEKHLKRITLSERSDKVPRCPSCSSTTGNIMLLVRENYTPVEANMRVTLEAKKELSQGAIIESPSNRHQQPTVGMIPCLLPSTNLAKNRQVQLRKKTELANSIASTNGQGRIQELTNEK